MDSSSLKPIPLGRKDIVQDSPKKDSINSVSESPKAVIQTGTQTSPEGTTAIKGHFSIGSGGKEERVSPKLSRKERSVSRTAKRAISPAQSQVLISIKCYDFRLT